MLKVRQHRVAMHRGQKLLRTEATSKGQEAVRQKPKIKELCEGRKPVNEALGSLSCIGVWRMCEVLPLVV